MTVNSKSENLSQEHGFSEELPEKLRSCGETRSLQMFVTLTSTITSCKAAMALHLEANFS